jgi:hypothetical protein
MTPVHVAAEKNTRSVVGNKSFMSNQELFEKVRKLNLVSGKFALFGSAPLGIRNLRECADIDIIVEKKLFEELKEDTRFHIARSEFDTEYLQDDDIEILWKWEPGEWDVDKLIKDAETIDGLPFVKLEHLISYKEMRKSERDIRDLKLIEKYIKGEKLESIEKFIR